MSNRGIVSRRLASVRGISSSALPAPDLFSSPPSSNRQVLLQQDYLDLAQFFLSGVDDIIFPYTNILAPRDSLKFVTAIYDTLSSVSMFLHFV